MYRLLIVDDEPLVQIGMKSILDWDTYNISVCGTASNGREALEYIEKYHPQLVISDIKMPVMDGLELLRISRERFGTVPIFIMLTSYEDFNYAKEAIHYDASEYLLKVELSPETLGSAIREALLKLESLPDFHTLRDGDIRREFHDKFFLRLLNNLFDSPDQYLMQKKELGLQFDSDAYLCCCCQILAPPALEGNSEGIMKLCRSTLSMISELMERYLPTHPISHDMERFTLIIGLTQKQRENYETLLHDILNTVFTSLHNYFSVSIVCTVGCPCDKITLISSSYTQAGRLFAALPSTAVPTVAFYESSRFAREHPIDTLKISDFKDTLKQVLLEYDTEALHTIQKDVTEKLSSAPENEAQARDNASNILYLIMATLPEGEETVNQIFSSYPGGYRSLYGNLTVAQTVEWLNVLFKGLEEYFSGRKINRKQRTVSQVQQYIQSHIHEKLSLNGVADVFSLSPSYLSSLFAKNCEYSFTEYINYQKIQEAKKMLLEGQMKIYEIAETLGYENAFYFSKVFKKVEGVSPRDYLNQTQDS